MDMREMVDRVKRGEPLYGKSEMNDYMQGVAARNSRYTGTFLHVVPMFNFVNHNQVSKLVETFPFVVLVATSGEGFCETCWLREEMGANWCYTAWCGYCEVLSAGGEGVGGGEAGEGRGVEEWVGDLSSLGRDSFIRFERVCFSRTWIRRTCKCIELAS